MLAISARFSSGCDFVSCASPGVRFTGTSDTRGSGGWVGGVGWTSVSFGDAGGVGGWGEVRGRAAIAYCFLGTPRRRVRLGISLLIW